LFDIGVSSGREARRHCRTRYIADLSDVKVPGNHLFSVMNAAIRCVSLMSSPACPIAVPLPWMTGTVTEVQEIDEADGELAMATIIALCQQHLR
jgi:hypothetical protein